MRARTLVSNHRTINKPPWIINHKKLILFLIQLILYLLIIRKKIPELEKFLPNKENKPKLSERKIK